MLLPDRIHLHCGNQGWESQIRDPTFLWHRYRCHSDRLGSLPFVAGLRVQCIRHPRLRPAIDNVAHRLLDPMNQCSPLIRAA